MGLKGSGPYIQRSMASVVLAGLVYIICEIYSDDVLMHGSSKEDFLDNLQKVLDWFRQFNVAANPKKTKLWLSEIEYVGHVVSSEGTSFTDEKGLIESDSVGVFLNRSCIYCPVIDLTTVANAYRTVT